MSKLNMFAPFAKTVEKEDGGREVWGWATLEVVDKSGEIADFEGTVKAFEKWSNETSKRTNGKSLGNIRLMHGPVAIGKTIHWSPSETTITDENGNEKTVKGIWVGGYIPPTKQEVIRDIDEGILSAFSIGGSYQKRWWDDGAQAFRFVPELSEYSLVDNPAVPNASVEQVIQKADVPWNRKEGAEMSEEITKDHTPKGGENEMTKGDGKMEVEQLTKAAEQAGLTLDQVQSFLKALTVPTVDGDGDSDGNKEFPAPDDDASDAGKVESDVKAAEEEVGVAEKSAEGEVTKAEMAPDDNEPDEDEEGDDKAEKSAPTELEKAGKSISNKNGVHLQHAANHIDAVVKGADYTHEDHLTVESQFGQGGTGEEAPEVDVEKVFSAIFTPIIEATVAKALEGQMQKSAGENELAKGFTKAVDDLKSMFKDLASQEDLSKAVSELEAVKALVKEIHETPQAGGPLLNGGNPAFVMKDVTSGNVSKSALEKAISLEKDPVMKDKLSQILAQEEARQLFR